MDINVNYDHYVKVLQARDNEDKAGANINYDLLGKIMDAKHINNGFPTYFFRQKSWQLALRRQKVSVV